MFAGGLALVSFCISRSGLGTTHLIYCIVVLVCCIPGSGGAPCEERSSRARDALLAEPEGVDDVYGPAGV